jgi:mono/diheme cytochrome c family protein
MRTSLLFVTILLSISCAGKQLTQDKLAQNPGALLFNGYTKPEVTCYKCHNGDASGASIKGPNLVKKLQKISDEEYRTALAKGPLLMPSYEKLLTPEEMQLILDWLKSLPK